MVQLVAVQRSDFKQRVMLTFFVAFFVFEFFELLFFNEKILLAKDDFVYVFDAWRK